MRAKRFFCSLLCAALIIALQPAAAFAASDADSLIFDVSEGNISINAAGDGYLTVTYGPEQTTTGAFPDTNGIILTGTTTIHTVAVGSGAETNITLYSVSIDVAPGNVSAFGIEGADVSLTLEGTNTLKSSGNYAGLYCPAGAALTINGSGSLSATGGGDPATGGGAGIGGNAGGGGGTITINGGTVTATAPIGGAGIGGGSGASGGTVEINGGTVTATSQNNSSGNGGAGIGGGYLGSGGTVIISGGIVKATGRFGAGIGGGSYGNGGSVEINGGTVTATGFYSAGIGGGDNGGHGGDVVISGGSVNTASKGQAIGAGPGGSYNGTLTNGREDVFLTKLTLTGAADTPIPEENLLFGGMAAGYGKTDLKTDSAGILYFYFPEGGTTAVYNGNVYTENVENNHGNTLLPTGQKAFTVDYDLTGLSQDNPAILAIGDQAFDATLIPDNGFSLPDDITVEMGGGVLTPGLDYTYDSATGGISIGNVSGSILIKASGEAMVFAVTAEPASLSFGSASEGYTAAPEAQTVTIMNTGNQIVTLTQPSGTNYVIGTLTASVLGPDESATFTVQPAAELSVGSYNETVTVSAGDGASASADVSFTVTEVDGGTVRHTVSAAQSAGGTINLSATTVEDHGAVNITVKPDKGYRVVSLLINGASVGAVKKYTVNNITEDISVSAVFKPVKESNQGYPFYNSMHGKSKHSGKIKQDHGRYDRQDQHDRSDRYDRLKQHGRQD
ncbi:MAG TPA: hypothetical protein VN381_02085 [Anaerovoracaceae bacterium]|nr:hypothetical protein [Anaerovoracaceae bacterium]